MGTRNKNKKTKGSNHLELLNSLLFLIFYIFSRQIHQLNTPKQNRIQTFKSPKSSASRMSCETLFTHIYIYASA